jgi:ATP-dependent Clp protease protease subunit
VSAHNDIDNLFKYGVDVRNRRIFLDYSLDKEGLAGENISESVIRGLTYLDKKDATIEIFVNTPGGYFEEMFAIYDMIRSCKSTIITVGIGEICSAGCLILTCGDKRFAMPNAWFMSHYSSTHISDTIDIARNQMAIWERMQDRWAALMAKHSKHTKKWWNEIHKGETREFWLDAKGMVTHGLVDGIYGETETN